jgi:hypothetical protein
MMKTSATYKLLVKFGADLLYCAGVDQQTNCGAPPD